MEIYIFHTRVYYPMEVIGMWTKNERIDTLLMGIIIGVTAVAIANNLYFVRKASPKIVYAVDINADKKLDLVVEDGYKNRFGFVKVNERYERADIYLEKILQKKELTDHSALKN